MVLGNFIVEVVISFGPKDPSVASEKRSPDVRSADSGPSPKSIQTNLEGYPLVVRLHTTRDYGTRLWRP